jgi:hypothetical protein
VVLVERSLANKHCCWEGAEFGATLVETVLAKDKWCQEEAAAQQRRAEEEDVTAPVKPHDHVDVAIYCIQAECALRAAPLDAILAKIACGNILHNVPALPMTTSPPPTAMLSTSPCPTSYMDAVQSSKGGGACVIGSTIAYCRWPAPTSKLMHLTWLSHW